MPTIEQLESIIDAQNVLLKALIAERAARSTPAPAAPVSTAPPVDAPAATAPAPISQATAPGMVAVRPTGAYANGVVRFYPPPEATDINFWTYVTRMSRIVDISTGKPYFPESAVGSVVLYPGHGVAFPEEMDRMTHSEDWETQEEHDRRVEIADAQAQHFATAMATGPFDPNALTDLEKNYAMACAAEMTFDTRQLGFGLFNGPEVGSMGSQKYETGPANFRFKETEAQVNPALVQAIREMGSGVVTPWMGRAFPELASPRWRADHLKAWADGWARLHSTLHS